MSALPENSKNVYSMVGFRVGNTLSESGTVSVSYTHLSDSCRYRWKSERDADFALHGRLAGSFLAKGGRLSLIHISQEE